MSSNIRLPWPLISFLVFIAGFLVQIYLIHKGQFSTAFIVYGLAIAVFCLCIGMAINGQPGGLIIDSRNCMSFSKLQAVAWTILVLAGWSTFVLVRLKLGQGMAAVEIAIPGELLGAMGLSAASLVAAPIILNQKQPDPSNAAQAEKTADRLGDTGNVADGGPLYARTDPSTAQWMDLFRGDEVGNAAHADLGKVQQFLITTIILIVYASSIFALLMKIPASDNPLGSLPPLGDNFIWLLAISHAGYLGYKAAPHASPNSPAGDAGAGAQADGSAAVG